MVSFISCFHVVKYKKVIREENETWVKAGSHSSLQCYKDVIFHYYLLYATLLNASSSV